MFAIDVCRIERYPWVALPFLRMGTWAFWDIFGRDKGFFGGNILRNV